MSGLRSWTGREFHRRGLAAAKVLWPWLQAECSRHHASRNVSWPQRAPSAVGHETAVISQVEAPARTATGELGRTNTVGPRSQTQTDHATNVTLTVVRILCYTLWCNLKWQQHVKTNLFPVATKIITNMHTCSSVIMLAYTYLTRNFKSILTCLNDYGGIWEVFLFKMSTALNLWFLNAKFQLFLTTPQNFLWI